MAAEGFLRDLLKEATCPICRDFFQDPVLIPKCGHNFCRGCLTRSWGTSKSKASCPRCRQIYRPRSLLPNRQLARLLEVTRRCGGPGSEEGGRFCPKHREPLKLFCKDHETLICWVCLQSKEHKGHVVIPAEEALEEYQDIGSILKKYRAKETYENPVDLLLDPNWKIWDYSDTPKLWRRAMKTIRENVILDPDTAHPEWLNISKNRKSVKGLQPAKKINAVPNGKRFKYDPHVLGRQMFSSGRHFWEVMVGDKEGWVLGVVSKRKNLTNVHGQTKHWHIGKCRGKYLAISLSGRSELVLTEEPTRICISLNCGGGQLSFFDANTAALLHRFLDASLAGETLVPFLFLSDGACVTFS